MSLFEKVKSAWFAIGDFMGNIMSTVLLTILFYIFVTPFSFILKLCGTDLMRKTAASTKWRPKESHGENITKPY